MNTPDYAARDADWRMGALVYQVWPDRFVPAADLDAKRHLYPAPKRLRTWDELPAKGEFLPEVGVWSHEIDFWGGDLASLRTGLDHVASLGADVLYLNPVHLAWTNHGYDALDYEAVRPEYGTRDDVAALAEDLHARGMRLVLDGVFNHVGRHSELFRAAEADGSTRDYFDFGPSYDGGARTWWWAHNLPELNHENPEVRDWLWNSPDSVVRRWLRDGIDGWRLDVAFDLGFRWLAELTAAAHAEKPGSLTLGEITGYADAWFGSLDGVLTFNTRQTLLLVAKGEIDARLGADALRRTYTDGDIEHHLMSWLYLDNHDTPRLATVLPHVARRRLATALQFTLPGSVNLFYGSELGMTGGDDPGMRAPMRWDLVSDDNEWFSFTRSLVEARKEHRALRVGDVRFLESDTAIAFERFTDVTTESVVVVANPSAIPVRAHVLLSDARLVDGVDMGDVLGGGLVARAMNGWLALDLPAHTVVGLQPLVRPGYSPLKRLDQLP